jgi:repressor LexA
MTKQDDRLLKLRRFYSRQRRMPSLGELAGLFDFRSRNAARYLAAKWIEAGVIMKDAAGRLLPGRSFFPVKVLGTVEAGFPSPAEEEAADTISLDDWLIENREASFMLRVSGDSMIEAGIMPGDTVILVRGRQPCNGDVVVAEVDRQWTIKFFEKRGSSVVLRPANSKYRPIVPKEELRVAGVVTAVIRKY